MNEQMPSPERPTRLDALDEIAPPLRPFSDLEAHRDSSPVLVTVARRRVARLARIALLLAGLGFGLWYWQQVRGDFFDGFRNEPDVRELIREGVR